MSLFDKFKTYEPETSGDLNFEDIIYELQNDGTTKIVDVPDDTEADENVSND